MANFRQVQAEIVNVNPIIKDLTDGVATDLFEVAVASGEQHVVRIIYNERVVDSTPHLQNHLGEAVLNVVNNGGTIAATINDLDEITTISSGTITDSWAAAAGASKVTISVNSNSSLGAITSFKIFYSIRSMTNPQITIL